MKEYPTEISLSSSHRVPGHGPTSEQSTPGTVNCRKPLLYERDCVSQPPWGDTALSCSSPTKPFSSFDYFTDGDAECIFVTNLEKTLKGVIFFF